MKPSSETHSSVGSKNLSNPLVFASPIKHSEIPLNSVQHLVKLKEKAIEELDDFPSLSPSKSKSIKNKFVNVSPFTQNLNKFNDNYNRNITNDTPVNNNINRHDDSSNNNDKDNGSKLSKSEINRMNVIANRMTPSPSKKNLTKLKAIQSKLDTSPKRDNNNSDTSNSRGSGINSSTFTKTFSTKNINKHLNTATKSDTDDLKLYSFICRMIEIKKWIENLLKINLNINISNIDEFPEYLTNGVLLAEVVKHFNPSSKKKVFNPDSTYKLGRKKDFRFTENIVFFLNFTKDIKLPSMFIFETNDLYERKNIPKVIACLHALACLIGTPIEPIDISGIDIDNDKLRKIKHSIGNNILSKKYIEGFNEAVRVNMGGDIKPIKLIEFEDPVLSINKESIIEKPKMTLGALEDNIKEEKEERDYDDEKSSNFQSLESPIASSISLSSLDKIDSLIDNSIDIYQPPSDKQMQQAREARLLFNNDDNLLPSMPSIHSFNEIQEKYMFLIDEENKDLMLDHQNIEVSKDEKTSNILDIETIIKLQAVSRGFLIRFNLFVDKMMFKKNEPSIIKFQAICRGFMKRNLIDTNKSKITPGNSILVDKKIEDEFGSSEMMKTLLKNKTVYQDMMRKLPESRKYEDQIVTLQSLIRSKFIKDKYWEMRKSLLHDLNLIIKLQSKFRGGIIRKQIIDGVYQKPIKTIVTEKTRKPNDFKTYKVVKVEPFSKQNHHQTSKQNNNYEDDLFETFSSDPNSSAIFTPLNAPSTPPLSPKKRNISKIQHSPTKISLNKFVQPLKPLDPPNLQIKNDDQETLSTNPVIFKEKNKNKSTLTDDEAIELSKLRQEKHLSKYNGEIIALQSLARGNIVRYQLNSFIGNIYTNEKTFSNFISICKGAIARNAYRHIRHELNSFQNEIITIQCLLRGIDTRVEYDCLIEDLTDYSFEIKSLQSVIRGNCLRNKIKERNDYYKRPDNLAKIIRLQAIIRGLKGSNDYKSLINEPNPPLTAVKRFINLLSGNQGIQIVNDEKEIMKLKVGINDEQERLRKEIDNLNKLKEKVIVLRKNGIKVKDIENKLNLNVESGFDEINKTNQTLNLTLINTNNIENNIDVDGTINGDTSCLGTFFWVLQNKNYWPQVLDFIEVDETIVEFSYGNIEDWVLKCFNYNDLKYETNYETTKEEGLFMKLIVSTFSMFAKRYDDESFKQFIKERRNIKYHVFNWELLIHTFLNMPQMRKTMKQDFGDLVFLVTCDSEITFECDPMNIYEDFEDEIDRKQRLDVEVGNIAPLDIQIVNDQFVKNMQNLRDTVFAIFDMIFRNIARIPNFLRTLLKEIYDNLKNNFELNDTYLLGFIGSIFTKCYIIPMFLQPINYSIKIEEFGEQYDNVFRNLELAGIVINQCAFMKPFDLENEPYLTCLNPFIEKLRISMKDFLKELIDVSNIELTYKKNFTVDENDLKIKLNDVIELVSIWRDFEREIIKDNSLELTINEIKNLKEISYDKHGFIQIHIKNVVNYDEVINSRLIIEAKKYLIYILQIQSGEDLVDLLVNQITPADELKYKEIIKRECKLNINNEMQKLSFPEVKKRTIEMLHELENRGLVDSSDGYMKMVNLIADDIRHKREVEDKRIKEKQIIVDSLTALKKRSNIYHNVYQEYDIIIKKELNDRLTNTLFPPELNKSSASNNSNNFSSSTASNSSTASKSKKMFMKLFRRSGEKLKLKGLASSTSTTIPSITRSKEKQKPKDSIKIPAKSLVEKGVIVDGTNITGRSEAILKCTAPNTFLLTAPSLNRQVKIDDLLSKYNTDAADRALLKIIISSFYM